MVAACMPIDKYIHIETYLIICISMEQVQKSGDGKSKMKRLAKIRYIFGHIN